MEKKVREMNNIYNFSYTDKFIQEKSKRLKKQDWKEKTETWEGEFYQSEWVKINSRWVIFIFFHACFILYTAWADENQLKCEK